jgi:acetyl esterase/lipase
VYEPVDDVDNVSARPDFMVLGYPVSSGNARAYLINPRQVPMLPPQKQELYDEYPTDLQITADTPKTFIVAADDDKTVPTENSIRFYLGLKKAGIPAELHLFAVGKHGFAIRQATGPVALWTDLCREWMNQIGLFNN